MGFDEITWSPRVGSSGDDAYNVPGAVKLDASQDSGNPSRLDFGDVSGFSTTPTVAQVNASSSINQVLGYLKKRITDCNAAYGSSLTPYTYLSGGRWTASDITSIQSLINSLRTTEGLASYTFDNTLLAAGKRAAGTTLAQLRKSLRIAGTWTAPAKWIAHIYERDDAPYGTKYDESMSAAFSNTTLTPQFAGKIYGGTHSGSYVTRRVRGLNSIALPAWMTSVVSGSIYFSHVAAGTSLSSLLETTTARAYLSYNDLHGSPSYADAGAMDVLLDEKTLSGTSSAWTISLAAGDITPYAGGYMSLIFATGAEATSAGAGCTFSAEAFIEHSGYAGVFTVDLGA